MGTIPVLSDPRPQSADGSGSAPTPSEAYRKNLLGDKFQPDMSYDPGKPPMVENPVVEYDPQEKLVGPWQMDPLPQKIDTAQPAMPEAPVAAPKPPQAAPAMDDFADLPDFADPEPFDPEANTQMMADASGMSFQEMLDLPDNPWWQAPPADQTGMAAYGEGYAPFGEVGGQGQFTGSVDGEQATTADFLGATEKAQSTPNQLFRNTQEFWMGVDEWAAKQIEAYDATVAKGEANDQSARREAFPEIDAAREKVLGILGEDGIAEIAALPLQERRARLEAAGISQIEWSYATEQPREQAAGLDGFVMAMEGLRSAARWLSMNPGNIRPEEMLAPAGASFMAAPFMRNVMKATGTRGVEEMMAGAVARADQEQGSRAGMAINAAAERDPARHAKQFLADRYGHDIPWVEENWAFKNPEDYDKLARNQGWYGDAREALPDGIPPAPEKMAVDEKVFRSFHNVPNRLERKVREAVEIYTGMEGAYQVNDFLRRGRLQTRSGKPIDDPKLLAKVQNGIERIDRAFEHPDAKLPADVRLFRGLRSKRDYEVGGTIVDPAYQSTSLTRETLDMFGRGTIYEIHARAGQRGLSTAATSFFVAEEEILLPRNTKFRIVGKSEDVENDRVIYQVVIEEGEDGQR